MIFAEAVRKHWPTDATDARLFSVRCFCCSRCSQRSLLIPRDSNAPSRTNRSRFRVLFRVDWACSLSKAFGVFQNSPSPAVRDVEGRRLMLAMLGSWDTRVGGAVTGLMM